MRSTLSKTLTLGAALLLAACGGGGDDGGTTNPPPAAVLDNVTLTPATFSVGAGQTQNLTAAGRSAAGATLSGVQYSYASSNTAVASVSQSGAVLGVSAGTATITVTASLSGVTKNATAAATVTGSLPNAVTVVSGTGANTFTPASVAIARGGTVTWTFGDLVHNVDFQGASGAPAGVPNTTNASVARTFANAGNFGYVCTLHSGMAGTVLVP